MTNNDYIVVFTSNTALVIRDPKRIKELKGKKNVLFNPEIGEASNVNPRYWKLVKNKITVMNASERFIRDQSIKKYGLDYNYSKPSFLKKHRYLVVTLITGVIIVWLVLR